MLPDAPRIIPLELDQVPDEDVEPFGGRNNPRCELNFFKTLIQHPSLLKSYTPFAMQLGANPLIPLRDKEIVIFRTCFLCHEVYESAHHMHIARQVGLTDDEIEAARYGGAGLPPFERALVTAVEELVSEQCISNETWDVLAERYTTEQLIELVFMVGNYTLLAMVNNSLGIQPEEDVEHAWKPGG